MEFLNWELSVLARSVAYPNLSTAASHVGVSQPQLSRIISRLEKELSVQLLERESKRKAAWTALAFELADTYSRTATGFQNEVSRIAQGLSFSHIRFASLEGLASTAIEISKNLFKLLPIKVLELDTLDLSELEEVYLKRGYDFVLTSREPGRRKLPYVKKLGYQSFEVQKNTKSAFKVLSSYEFGINKDKGQQDKVFVSNSLDVRKSWIAQVGGEGRLPTRLTTDARSGDVPVLFIGASDLPTAFWKRVLQALDQNSVL